MEKSLTHWNRINVKHISSLHFKSLYVLKNHFQVSKTPEIIIKLYGLGLQLRRRRHHVINSNRNCNIYYALSLHALKYLSQNYWLRESYVFVIDGDNNSNNILTGLPKILRMYVFVSNGPTTLRMSSRFAKNCLTLDSRELSSVN